MKISVERYRATDYLKKSLKRRLVTSRSIIPALIIASVILLACLHVWQRVHVMGLVQEVTELRTANDKLKDMTKKKTAKNLELSRLSRIEKLARDKLQMTSMAAGNTYTLTVQDHRLKNAGLDEVVTSLKKFADHLPVLTEGKAETVDLFENYEE